MAGIDGAAPRFKNHFSKLMAGIDGAAPRFMNINRDSSLFVCVLILWNANPGGIPSILERFCPGIYELRRSSNNM